MWRLSLAVALGLNSFDLSMRVLSSLTRDWTCTPCMGRWSLNHWATREAPPRRLYFFKFIYFNWRLITLQHGCFCHTFTWISHGCTCVPHPEPPSHLPPHPIPQGHPSQGTNPEHPVSCTWYLLNGYVPWVSRGLLIPCSENTASSLNLWRYQSGIKVMPLFSSL